MKSVTRSALAMVCLMGCVLLLTPAARAQNGCDHSPECPTAVLGVVGAAGAALYARLRR